MQQLALLEQGGTTVEAQARLFLDRYQGARHLNAFIATLPADELLAKARDCDRRRREGMPCGPLTGLLICVKDNIHVAGFANTAGTPGLRDFRPAADAEAFATLRASGAICVGKTNMHELAFGITSANAAFGAVRNPLAPEKFAGGSSGGTAAAIAAGLVPAGLGTDTGGSARIPAALCGIAGFRPSSGRYSQIGVTPISRTRDTIGVMGRTVEDIALLHAVLMKQDLSGDRPSPPPIRLGVCSYFFEGIDFETQAIIDGALRRLQSRGVDLVDVEIPDIASLMADSAFPIAMYEVTRDLRNYLAEYGTGVDLEALLRGVASADVKGLLGSAMHDIEHSDVARYNAALASREQLTRRYHEAFATHGVTALAMPTTPLPSRDIAPMLDTVELNGARVPTFPTYIRNAEPATIVGLPSLSIPAGRTRSGLPVGLLLDGLDDATLLAAGRAIQDWLSRESMKNKGSP